MNAPRCTDGHCVTCADEGVPMRVVRAGTDGLALCEDDEGRSSEVMTTLVEPVCAGDRVLVHAGTALVRLEGGGR
jgi:hydrogenase maturation factor